MSTQRIHDPLPLVRIRINHTYTVKDGWRLSDTTVEMTVPIPDEAAGEAIFPTLAGLLRNTYQTGKEETTKRQWEEGRTTNNHTS
jgi:hypothetical protein